MSVIQSNYLYILSIYNEN